MGILSGAANAYFTYKFIRLLTQDWKDTDAFKAGVVDENGKALKRVRDLTPEQKETYTVFNRLVFNFKRILQKLPFGSSRFASYAAALFLIKEHANINDDQMEELLEEAGLITSFDNNMKLINESYLINETNQLSPGSYSLTTEIASPLSGEIIGKRGHTVLVSELSDPIHVLSGVPIYEAKHKLSGQRIFITIEDVKR